MIDKGNTMTNYDMDELRRQEQKKVEKKLSTNWPKSVEVGKDEEAWETVNVEMEDETFMRIAREAHARDITVNKMVNIILRDGIKTAEYRYEHDSKPQLLNEDK